MNRIALNKSVAPRGFTLIELLVVITIIGILIGLLLPAVQMVRAAAGNIQCQNNLKQLALATLNYESTYGHFPPGGYDEQNNGNRMGWPAFILPQIEQTALSDQLNFEGDYLSGVNKQAALTPVPTFFCPMQPQQKSQLFPIFNSRGEQFQGEDTYTTHYYSVAGPKGPQVVGTGDYPIDSPNEACGGFAKSGIMHLNSKTRTGAIPDGLSNTLLLGEISWSEIQTLRIWTRGCSQGGCGWCAGCKNILNAMNLESYTTFSQDFNDVSFGSEHSGGANFAYADGSVAFVAEQIDLNVYKATASRNGKEVETLR